MKYNNLMKELILENSWYEQINSKNTIEDFYVSSKSKFMDDIWDFSELNTEKRQKSHFLLKFDNIEQKDYQIITKLYILNYVRVEENKITSTHTALQVVKKIIKILSRLGAVVPSLIIESVIADYIKDRVEKVNSGMIEKEFRILKHFLGKVEKYYDIKLINEQKLILDNLNKYKGKISKKSKNGYIPNNYLKKIIEKINEVINDEAVSLDKRIVAGMIGISAYTGMRTEELTLLKRGKLEQISFNNNKINILRFKTFKTVGRRKKYRDTACFIEEDGAIMYKKVEKLVELQIEKFSNRTKEKALYYYLTGRYIKKVRVLPQYALDELYSLSEEEFEKLVNKMGEYIWINKYGLKSSGSTCFATRVRIFFLEHFEFFNAINMNENEEKQIKIFKISNSETYKRMLNVKIKEKFSFDALKKIPIRYVNIHQFRVTMCTNLYLQKVPLDYIVKHMNHLSEDMTNYYIKDELFIDQLTECLDLIRPFSNEENSKKDYNTIYDNKKLEKFLRQSDLNINRDLKKIKKTLKGLNTEILTNDFGLCINSIINGICEKREFFAQYTQNLYTGVHLENYKFLNLHIEKLKQEIDIYKHNKEVSQNTVELTRQKNIINNYAVNIVMREIKLLEEDIEKYGSEKISEEYCNLVKVIDRLDVIKKDVEKCIS